MEFSCSLYIQLGWQAQAETLYTKLFKLYYKTVDKKTSIKPLKNSEYKLNTID